MCSAVWYRAKNMFSVSKSPHSRVLCCNPGSKLTNNASLLEKGSDHSATSFTWAVTDEDACTKCTDGQYTGTYSLATKCKTCERNTFAPGAGLTSCSNCTIGKFSNDGITCDVCSAGKKNIAGDECEKCQKGRYSETALLIGKDCLVCPTGWYQQKEGKQFCLPCIRKYIYWCLKMLSLLFQLK